jgi:hypothetical protein
LKSLQKDTEKATQLIIAHWFENRRIKLESNFKICISGDNKVEQKQLWMMQVGSKQYIDICHYENIII